MPSRRWPRRSPCTAWSSTDAVTTPGIAVTTSRRSCGSPASGRTSARTSGPGCSSTSQPVGRRRRSAENQDAKDRAVKSVDQHVQEVLRTVDPLPPLPLPLADAHGCVLAEDVTARAPLPGFDNSAMDGYAVRLEDVAGATETTPVRLGVVGDIAAGSRGGITVQPGFCARIMTGAPLPPGAD